MRSEQVRQALYRSLCDALGEPQAGEVMEMLDKVDRMLLAQEGGAAALRGEMAELRGETRALASQLRGEMAKLSSELRGEMATLSSELRGEMAELRGEVRGMLPKLVAANVASMVGVSGLVVAAAQLL